MQDHQEIGRAVCPLALYSGGTTRHRDHGRQGAAVFIPLPSIVEAHTNAVGCSHLVGEQGRAKARFSVVTFNLTDAAKLSSPYPCVIIEKRR